MTRRQWLHGATATILLQTSRAQGSPNFSGVWALDVARCRIPDGSPELPALKQTIEHKGSTLTITNEITGDARIPAFLVGLAAPRMLFTTDDTENTNKLGPIDFVSKSKWVGSTLSTTFQVKTPLEPPHGKWRHSLSEDTRSLTIDVEFNGPDGSSDVRLTFAR
jgi:hypothetical protein